MDNKIELKCFTCGNKFTENDITFQCKKCDKNYCYKCFCKYHFEQHNIWEVFMVKDGKCELILSEKEPLEELKNRTFPRSLFKKFWEKKSPTQKNNSM